MNTGHDVNRVVRSWLREDDHESADRILGTVLDRLDTTPQRRFWWPARRDSRMHKLALAAAATAAALLVAVAGYNLLPRLGTVGPGASPSPTPELLARGSFVIRDWDGVEFEATRTGSMIQGGMTVGLSQGSPDSLRVSFECVQTTDDGLMVIGGITVAGAGRFAGTRPGTFAAIAVKPGSPVKAQIWGYGQLPGIQTSDCRANANAWSLQISRSGDLVLRDDIEGTVQFGP